MRSERRELLQLLNLRGWDQRLRVRRSRRDEPWGMQWLAKVEGVIVMRARTADAAREGALRRLLPLPCLVPTWEIAADLKARRG